MSIKDQIRAEIERRFWDYGTPLHDEEVTKKVDEILDFLDTLPEQPVGKTCKTCGFYENNCPFIRGKFIPYPNKVCKDYTYSVMKAQEQPVEGTVVELGGANKELSISVGMDELNQVLRPLGLKEGDKVKIIIVK